MWLTEVYYEKMLKLIKCVQERPSLWNAAHDDYYNRVLSRKYWSEIEDECDMEPGSAAKKWKNMKDTYRKELRKGVGNSNWLYAKQMSFLQTIWGTSTNIVNKRAPFIEENEQSLENEDVSTDNSSENTNQIQEKEQKKSEITVKARLMEPTILKSDIHFIEQANSNNFIEIIDDDNNDDSDDYHFLRSCHQYLSKLPEQKKLKFRIEMQKLMFDFLYND